MVSSNARKMLEAHIAGERAHDMEALMEPLSDAPSYIVPNYLVEGRDAVRALYERSFKVMSPALLDEYLKALDDPEVTCWGENHCVLEYNDNYPLHRGMVVVVHFEGDRIKSENTYFNTSARFAGAAMDDGFAKLPGVTPLS